MDENTTSMSVNELTENDIPGATLHEPLESATVAVCKVLRYFKLHISPHTASPHITRGYLNPRSEFGCAKYLQMVQSSG